MSREANSARGAAGFRRDHPPHLQPRRQHHRHLLRNHCPPLGREDTALAGSADAARRSPSSQRRIKPDGRLLVTTTVQGLFSSGIPVAASRWGCPRSTGAAWAPRGSAVTGSGCSSRGGSGGLPGAGARRSPSRRSARPPGAASCRGSVSTPASDRSIAAEDIPRLKASARLPPIRAVETAPEALRNWHRNRRCAAAGEALERRHRARGRARGRAGVWIGRPAR